MTLRTSNVRALSILPPDSIEGIGWTVRFVSETDYETVLAHTARYAEASFSLELSEVGGFSVVMDADDPLWSLPLPAGQTGSILDREVVVQFLYEGLVRFEGLLEDVQPDEVGSDGSRRVRLTGRGLAALMERGISLPENMPAPLSLTREFTGPIMSGWLTLFAEAQARGIAQKIRPTFTATTDTYGEPWIDSVNRVVSPGENMLTLLDTYAEAADLTWLVLPGYRDLIVARNYGQRLADKVRFYQGRHVLESDRKVTRREIATSVFAQGADFSLATASGNSAKWGVREKWVTTGSGDISTAQMIATAEARVSGDEKISRSARVLFDAPGRKPFVDYTVGDWVGVETPSKAIAEVRIVAISVRVDEAGNAESEITLQTRFEAEEIRTRKALERLGSETTSESGGPLSVVQAVSATVRLRDLADVQASTPVDDQYLQLDSGLGAWVPAGLPASLSSGIVLISSASFTAASAVSVNNVFSSLYDSYRIQIDFTNATAATTIQARMRATGVDATAALYDFRGTVFGNDGGSASRAGASATSAELASLSVAAASRKNSLVIEVSGPALAESTTWFYNGYFSYNQNATASLHTTGAALLRDTNLYDGMTIYPASGSLTGRIRVYGYRNSV